MEYASLIAEETGISRQQAEATIKLLDEGASIPFISRYRKERTQGLDEVQIQAVSICYEKAKELEKRKNFIIDIIAQQGKLTDELRKKIEDCRNGTILEDIYLPYKQKKSTKADVARKNGLEPLAKIIMAQNATDIYHAASRFINSTITDQNMAVDGALNIIEEWIAENTGVRELVRKTFFHEAVLNCKVIKGKETDAANFQNYFDFSTPLKRCKSHQILAIRRGKDEGFLRTSIDIDPDKITEKISHRFLKNKSESALLVKKAVVNSYKRYIKPLIENEFAASSKTAADDQAIALFADNARQLLFAPPLGKKRILAIDPGYRTGCKLVCLDEQGNLLHNDTIYPTPPRKEISLSAKKLHNLIEAYKIDTIALGNGTACRETEDFLKSLYYNRDIHIYIVSEDGASVYSASKLAREEFPDKDVTVRGAISIGRRLLDPLAELVKIDPKSIGVGQYQHDVDQTKLKQALEFTVESCVNKVGVNLNTASKELLTYISGLGVQLAQNIVEYRAANGNFKNRKELLNVPRLGNKAFEQCAGFLRIPDSENPLDNTAVHPENYKTVEKMASDCGCSINELINDKAKRADIDINRYVTDNTGIPTLTDIMEELDKPGRDPRTTTGIVNFDSNIKSFNDLREGIIVNGIITNITQFGVFVDIGIKENGLVHISEICNHFISSPADVVKLHQHVKVKIKNIDTQRRRLSLSMKETN